MKTCATCRQLRDKSEFYHHPGTIDGLQSRCKPCMVAYRKAHRKVLAERQRIRYASDTERFRAEARERYKSVTREQKDKRNARRRELRAQKKQLP